MSVDVELMRDLLFVLETRQVSPRSTVIVAIEDLAEDLGVMPETVAGGLDQLLALDYIEGPGADEPGFWFFRKLTRKGTQFVRATRKPADWARIKRHYASKALS